MFWEVTFLGFGKSPFGVMTIQALYSCCGTCVYLDDHHQLAGELHMATGKRHRRRNRVHCVAVRTARMMPSMACHRWREKMMAPAQMRRTPSHQTRAQIQLPWE